MTIQARQAGASSALSSPEARMRSEDLAALIVFAVLAAIPLVTSGYVVYILPQYMLLGLLAMSLTILWGYGGIVSFGQAAFFAAGAYAMGLVMKYVTDPGVNTAYLGIVAGTAGGALIAVLIGYFLFSAGVRSSYFVVATLALSIVVEQTVKTFSDITGGWNGLYVDRMTLTLGSFFELSLYDDMPMYYAVLPVVVLAYVAVAALMRARFGKIVVGIRENEDRMLALGYNVPGYKTLALGLSGMLAGLAGALYATHASFAHPSNASVLFSTQVVIWVAIGGRHSLLGSFLGAIIVASLSNYLSSIKEIQAYWPLVMGLIFIAVIVLFRGGLAGMVESTTGLLFRRNRNGRPA